VEKSSAINIQVQLDENNVPVQMNWSASDAGVENKPCKAILLSIWDGNEQNALRIDLWNKDMSVEEMKFFFHQTMVTMTDTFERATGEEKMCGDMRDFCMYFAEKMKIV
jgi:gliding motility-associated protein GldC